ncbi:MAG TPA: exodeoxyribonuclease VII small subunit [Cyanobacteria bacterium UBA8530]|nr:exodeoxyribonuclease VII small subunit [Cyanobacteria bacterium UBA8530]
MDEKNDIESYKAALAELDKLLREFDGDGLDVDGLVEKVERGAQLLKYCQTKLRSTQLKVREVLASLEDSEVISEKSED